jgi:GTP-binding protein EngB required for normal cell division
MEIMSRAIEQRSKNQIGNLKYIPILTKIDQLPSSQSQALIHQVSSEVNLKIKPMAQSNLEIINAIPTSVKDKVGRDDVWDILRSVIMQ